MAAGLAWLLPLGLGAALAWWLSRGDLRLSRRVLAVIAALLLGAPVLLFVIANVLKSDVLGWIAGISMMFVLALAVPLGVGSLVGYTLARKKRGHSPAVVMPKTHAGTQDVVEDSAVRSRAKRGPHLGLLLAMAGVAAGFWVALVVGFRMHGQIVPAPLDAGFIPAVMVLGVVMVFGARHVWQSGAFFTDIARPRYFRRPRSNFAAERRAWLARLAADPLRQRYAAMIAAGDVFWTPARIEYDLDPQATTCCTHLAPIESAMRATGLRVRLDAAGSVRADCRIDAMALQQRFTPPECVRYEELRAYDRSVEDPPQAHVHCMSCRSRIWVVHPQEAAVNTPLFPSP